MELKDFEVGQRVFETFSDATGVVTEVNHDHVLVKIDGEPGPRIVKYSPELWEPAQVKDWSYAEAQRLAAAADAAIDAYNAYIEKQPKVVFISKIK